MLPAIRLISAAADLAARRHNGMARKGRGNEPYINHLAEVANLLAEVTDDMSLPKAERRQRQIEDAPHKSSAAKLIKIADKISNTGARIVPHPSKDERDDLADYAAWAEKVIVGCRGINPRLDRIFDDTIVRAQAALAETGG